MAGRKAGRDAFSICGVSLGSGNEMPFNFNVCFSFFPSVMLSGARKPLAAGCAFNKSNKAFIWLAACSLGLDWPGTHYLIQAPHRCPGWGVGGGGGREQGRPRCWEKQRLEVLHCSPGGQVMPGAGSRDLSAGPSSATS